MKPGEVVETEQKSLPMPAAPRTGLLHLPGNALLVAGGFAVVMFLCSLGLDWLLLVHHEGAVTTMMVSDALAGLIAGVLVLRLFQYERERRARIEVRLHTIGEMNHHIRNALEVISFSVHSAKDKSELAGINEALDRIQWALREILPKFEPTFRPLKNRRRKRDEVDGN